MDRAGNVVCIGHVIVTTCVHQGLKGVKPTLAYLPFLVGALFPDLIDKTLAIVTDLPGRSVSHSVVVLTTLSLAATIALPKRRNLTHAFVAGTMLHLIQDIPIQPTTLFWPLCGPLEQKDTVNFLVRLWRFYVEIDKPIPWAIEIMSLPWFMVILRNHWKKAPWIPSGNSRVTIPTGCCPNDAPEDLVEDRKGSSFLTLGQ
jgi:hypothetical protein